MRNFTILLLLLLLLEENLKLPSKLIKMTLDYFLRKYFKIFKTKTASIVKWKRFSRERGIRTPGPVTVNSFQDCRNRPLCQLSL
jgi:hypothetical protein